MVADRSAPEDAETRFARKVRRALVAADGPASPNDGDQEIIPGSSVDYGPENLEGAVGFDGSGVAKFVDGFDRADPVGSTPTVTERGDTGRAARSTGETTRRGSR